MDWDWEQGWDALKFGLVFFVLFGIIVAISGGFTASSDSSDTGNTFEDSSTTNIQQITPIQDHAYWSYGNCAEARSAGAAPVYASEPGYGSHLDRDNDGIGCE